MPVVVSPAVGVHTHHLPSRISPSRPSLPRAPQCPRFSARCYRKSGHGPRGPLHAGTPPEMPEGVGSTGRQPSCSQEPEHPQRAPCGAQVLALGSPPCVTSCWDANTTGYRPLLWSPSAPVCFPLLFLFPCRVCRDPTARHRGAHCLRKPEEGGLPLHPPRRRE